MKNIVIVGGGPAGVMCAIEAAKNPDNTIYIAEQKDVLATLLVTGGGRCNLAYNEPIPNRLVKYFPRGEKFLHSVFSRFGTNETVSFFEKIGVPTKIQDDQRIFPRSDSAADVRNALLKQLQKPNIRIIKGRILSVRKTDGGYDVSLENNGAESSMKADVVVLATGGSRAGHKLAADLGHRIVAPRPSLCALKITETKFYQLSGVSLKNDLLFTHSSLSGPLILKISSLCAFIDFDAKNPLEIEVNFVGQEQNEFRTLLKNEIQAHPKKDIINISSKFLPRDLAQILLEELGIGININCAELSGAKINSIAELFTSYTFHAIARVEKGAMVTAGGVSLEEVDGKTMESKIHKNLYFCGEVLNIDGLTGGFNLQNCWSTGFIVGRG